MDSIPVDDAHYEQKIADLQRRYDDQYDTRTAHYKEALIRHRKPFCENRCSAQHTTRRKVMAAGFRSARRRR